MTPEEIYEDFWEDLKLAAWNPASSFVSERDAAFHRMLTRNAQYAREFELGWLNEKVKQLKRSGLSPEQIRLELHNRFPQEITNLIEDEEVRLSPREDAGSQTVVPPQGSTEKSSGASAIRAYALPYKFTDHYVLLESIGSGGQADVFKAHYLPLDELRAIKVLRKDRSFQKQRFVDDAKIIARLRHEGVIRIHEAEFGNVDAPFYAMELIEGGNLHTNYRAFLHPGAVGAQDWSGSERVKQIRKVEKLFGKLVDVFSFLSRVVVNRDIKPANILLRSDDTPVVCDFGLAKSLHQGPSSPAPVSQIPASASEKNTQATQGILGTILFMSPQQLWNSFGATPCDDLWSLGVTLYILLTGVHPLSNHRWKFWPGDALSISPDDMKSVFADLASKRTSIIAPHVKNPSVSWELSAMVQRCLRLDTPPLEDGNHSVLDRASAAPHC